MKFNKYKSVFIVSILSISVTVNAQKKEGTPVARNVEKHKKPNIIYVLTDQWRAQATGYAGDPNVKTPNLDKLAGESVNFANAVSVLPVCTPHRAALLTGRYPTSTGMFQNDLHLPDDELTMAEIFKQGGYNTAYIGKWHLDGNGRTSFIPQERRQGFEYWKANECSHNYNQSPYYSGTDTVKHFWKGYDVIAETADAQQYISNHAGDDKPFILVLGYGAPHFPHETAPERFKELYDASSLILPENVDENLQKKARAEAIGYYAHITAIDSCVGALRRTIEEKGIDDNTIFVFTSDHGEMLGSHNTPPAKKQRPWDESVKVPFLLHYTALKNNKSKVIKVPINTPDILPTLLSLASLPKPATIEGDDLSGLITGALKLNDRAALFMNIAPFDEARKVDEYRGVRTSRYTYVKNLKGPWLFFDDEKDPYQMNNLVNDPKYKNVAEVLDKQLQEKLKAVGDNFQPREFYRNKWHLKVDEEGKIPYGAGPYKGQTPSLTAAAHEK